MDLAQVVEKIEDLSRKCSSNHSTDGVHNYSIGLRDAYSYALSLLRPILKDQTSFEGQSSLLMAREVLSRTRKQIGLSSSPTPALNCYVSELAYVVGQLSEVINQYLFGSPVKELRPIEESYIPSLGDDVIFRCLNGSYAAKVTKVGRNKMADLCVFWNLKGPQQELNVPLGSGLDKYLPKLQRAS